MKVLLSIYCFILMTEAKVLKNETIKLWEQFKMDHKKVYQDDVEDDYRRKVFSENLQYINNHNKMYEQGNTTFSMGTNQYSDMLFSEFSDMLLRRNKPANKTEKIAKLPKVDLPDSVDWRIKGGVTPVKDQGRCGSCWSFAATGALEGQHFISTGELVSLSEQNLMDCSKAYGNVGCYGGLEYLGYDYIADNGGVDTEQYYPFLAKNMKCKFNRDYIGATDTGYLHIKKRDEVELKNAVATVGPISVGIHATRGFSSYRRGILIDDSCSSEDLNHSVLVVGYGTEKGKDYWLVKNSWGTSFGKDGYIKMARNHNNMCGIATDASFPTVKK